MKTLFRLGASAAITLAACQESAARTEPAVPVPQPVMETTPAPDAPAANTAPNKTIAMPRPKAGSEIAVPAGVLTIGSATGSPGRNASREADAVEREIPAFSIDALPYPNDPARAPRAMTNLAEATALCRERGQRLCHELEWERACKGLGSEAEYPSSDFDPEKCAADVAACASPLFVFALGIWGREWTQSRVTQGLGDTLRSSVVRGAAKAAPKESHRCAARDAVTPDSKSESLLFRCCRGPESQLTYPEESKTEAFVEQSWDNAQVREVLAQMPETRAIADTFKLFTPEQLSQRPSHAGRARTNIAPWQSVPKGLLWSPMHGEQIGVIAGDTAQGAMLIVFYREPTGRAVFGTSYLTRNEHDAIIVAYKLETLREVLFSTCWGCGGEGGAVEIAADGRVKISLR